MVRPLLPVLFFGVLTVWAEQAQEIIQKLPTGQINWSYGILNTQGSFPLDFNIAEKPDISLAAKTDLARRQITPFVVENLALIKINARQYVSDLIMQDAGIRSKLAEMAAMAAVTLFKEHPDGTVDISVQMKLNGGFAQLILPLEIKQVETIRAVSNNSIQGETPRNQNLLGPSAQIDHETYTGLIVDARGIGAKPALVPVLLAENGKEVYGPAFISREYAVHNGVCNYVRSLKDAEQQRTGTKPLFVKGLRTAEERDCDIIISDADASILHGTSAHLTFMKQCRVTIIID